MAKKTLKILDTKNVSGGGGNSSEKNIEIATKEYVDRNRIVIPHTGFSADYIIFGQLNIPSIVANGISELSVIVAGTGGCGTPQSGIYVVTCSTRGVIKMVITELSPSGTNVGFGHYTEDNWVYFGIRRANWNFSTEIMKLSSGSNTTSEKLFKLYNLGNTQPEGWTEVGIRKFTLQE